MAKIENLVGKITSERLRKAIDSEVRALKKTKKFGLVFEEHLPETVRLPLLAGRAGEQVALKRESGNELWRVKRVYRGTATCERAAQSNEILNEPARDFLAFDLVVVRSFGEPIYSSPLAADRAQRARA